MVRQFVASPLVDNKQNEILWKLLANPADNGSLHGFNLQQLTKEFPQSGLLQALLARSNGGENLSHAAVCFNTRALYVVMNAYEDLAEVSEEQIIQTLNGSVNYGAAAQEEQAIQLNDFSDGKLKDLLGFEPVTHDVEEDEKPHNVESTEKVVVAEDERHEVETIAFEQAVDEEIAPVDPDPLKDLQETGIAPEIITPQDIEEPAELTEAFAEAEIAVELPAEEHHSAETPAEDHRAGAELSPFEEEVIEVPEEENPEPATELQAEETEPADTRHFGTFGDIDDEVFEEIADIDSISFAFAPDTPQEPRTAEKPAPEEDDNRNEIGKLMSQELVSADYLAFENSRQSEPDLETTEEPEVFTAESEVYTQPAEAETQDVSKYHDEKMPYTFMWWLDKTRKEHAGVYQPFKLDTTQAIRHTGDDTLQQQYYENIFHITSADDLDKNAPKTSVEFDMQDKEDRIIQKFISEEPQIGPPTSDKLGNENKARKSSEDQDEMVTETLARIYVDQMLYHKAINTYKKLILKFPEKSRYFADQIELLERKIN